MCWSSVYGQTTRLQIRRPSSSGTSSPPTGLRSRRSTGTGCETAWRRSRRRFRTWEDWNAAHLWGHRLVAELLGEVVGWAALSPASTRRCYLGVVEDSIYVAREAHGLGIGRALLEELIAGAEATGIWTIQTSIFPENRASLALHERCGFRVVGTRERVAKRDGIWRDTVFLERRSEVIS